MNTKGLAERLWGAANKLRGNISPSDYKYVVLGLIFLKYVSDAFSVRYQEAIDENYDPEDHDWYLAENVFWISEKARWEYLAARAKQPEIGVLVDDAMEAIAHDNPSLKGVLPKDYAREALDKRRLGGLIDLFTNIKFDTVSAGDLLGRVYEYFMGKFADSEGRRGGEFYTPRSIVQLLVEMLEPYSGRVYDPCCGSGGMFVWSEKFVKKHAGRTSDIAVYGQELNETTWRLAKMNMAIRGIDANIKRGDTLVDDRLPSLKADYILANPPFNIRDWGQERLQNDVRWKYGLPPKGNANFAWIQHMIYHLGLHGTAGFVLANGSMSSQTGGEGDIRKQLVLNDMVDAIVTLPSQLFFNVATPCCLWFVSHDRANRHGKVLFIDGRNLGEMVERRRKLTEEAIAQVVKAYHDYKTASADYIDQPGFCKVADLKEIKQNDYVLTPGRYVGVEETEEDDEPFAEKFARLTAEIKGQFVVSRELEAKIKDNLAKIGKEVK